MKQKNLETTDSSLKDEIRKLRSLPKGKRWEYFWMYDKIPLLILIAGILFLWMLGSFAVSAFLGTFFPKEPISMAVAASGFTDCDEWMEACLDAIGYDEKREKMQVLTSVPYNPEREDFVISSTLWLTAGQPDVFIVDQASYNYLLTLDILADTAAWPEELQALAGNRRVDAYALEITDTLFVRRHGLEGTIYLCMNVSGQGYDRALDIVKYLLSEPAA